MSPELVSGSGERVGGLQLGGSNAGKWVDHQKKKFFMNNSVEALIPFNEGYQGPLKLHVPLGGQYVGKMGLYHVALLQESQMSVGFYHRNLMLGI